MTAFQSHPPSSQWEQIPLAGLPGAVWCWFKPVQGPLDVYVRVPPEVFTAIGGAISIRRLLASLGISTSELESWTVNNAVIPYSPLSEPYLDQPLPWLAAPLVLRTRGVSTPVPMAAMTTPVLAVQHMHQPAALAAGSQTPAAAGSEMLFQRIDGDWATVSQIEAAMSQLRKQLSQLANRLKSFNRELSMEENNGADSLDKREWQDIRRALRDASNVVSRAIREVDVGDLSTSGGRTKFEELHREYIAPRRPHPHLLEVAADFELYRKLVQHQFQKVQAAASCGGRETEQRASAFIGRVAAKARSSRTSKH